MTAMRTIVFLLFAPLAGSVLAGRWTAVVDGPNRSVYVDTAGAVREAGVVRTWVREVYTDEQRSEQVGVYFYSANALVSYDCARRTFTPLFKVFYAGDGTELRRVALDAVEVPALAAPGSLQEGLLERACAPPKTENDAARKVAAAPTDVLPTPVSATGEHKPESGAAPEGAKASDPGKSDAAAATKADPVAPATAKPRPRSAVRPLGKPPAHLAARRAKPRATTKPKTAAAEQHEQVHWSYEGGGAPDKWGKLNRDYAACAEGERQSPIDIRNGARLELEAIQFDYQPAPLRIIDNGHTVQVNYAEGSSIQIAGERYELQQFHFHKPSEERIDGRAYDMVAHLVHRSLEGRLAVVAVLFEAGELPNAFLRGMWPHLPLEQDREIVLADTMIDLNQLLPEDRGYYAYMGSLTTPPCSEGVLWLVLKTSVPVAREQVGVFGRLYAMNARPVQPANGRLIKESN